MTAKHLESGEDGRRFVDASDRRLGGFREGPARSANGGVEPTPRQNLAQWAADRGHPALRFRVVPRRGQDEWVAVGAPSWEHFLATANDVEIALAVEAARQKDNR